MEAFLQLFGKVTVADVVLLVVAIGFLVGIYKKIKNCLIDTYDKEKAKDERIQKVLDLSENYPKWHQQSLDIQKEFTDSINDLKQAQQRQEKKIEEIEKDRRLRDQNKLGDKLLQLYQYYTNSNHNPMHAWTEMEKDAFDKLFKDYERLDGNGYMHSEVKPAMDSLEVIPMHETERVTELMHSRK